MNVFSPDVSIQTAVTVPCRHCFTIARMSTFSAGDVHPDAQAAAQLELGLGDATGDRDAAGGRVRHDRRRRRHGPPRTDPLDSRAHAAAAPGEWWRVLVSVEMLARRRRAAGPTARRRRAVVGAAAAGWCVLYCGDGNSGGGGDTWWWWWWYFCSAVGLECFVRTPTGRSRVWLNFGL